MTDAQYGMLTGYAYFLLLSVAMIVQGYVIDKYSLNRLYVVGFGGVLGAAGLLMQVCVSAAISCPHIYFVKSKGVRCSSCCTQDLVARPRTDLVIYKRAAKCGTSGI